MLRVTSRARAVVLAAGLSIGFLGVGAAVAAPPVLDRVPDDAMLVVTIPSLQNVHKNIQSLMTAIEVNLPLPDVETMLASQGVTQGVDTSKGVAIVVFAPPMDKAAPKDAKADKAGDKGEDGHDKAKGDEPVIALIPVSSYADMLKNFNVDKPSGGVDKVTMPTGDDAFVKDVGNGYAALSSNQALLNRFEGKSGGAALKGKLGRVCDQLADGSDVSVIANMDVIRPLWPEMRKQMSAKIKEKAEELPMPGEAPNPMENPAVKWLTDSLMADGRAAVLGVKAGSTGVNMDAAVNFTEGSMMAKAFGGTGKAGSLLAKLPGTPYLLAGALDFSSADLKAMAKQLASRAAEGNKEAAGALGLGDAQKRIDTTDGVAGVMGVPVGGIFGGLTTATVIYTATKDPAGYVAAQKEQLSAQNGKSTNGVSMATTFKESSTKVEGIDVDEYSVKITPGDDMGGEQAAQAIGMIFGPTGGPAGYLAKTEGGVYQTLGKNSDLLAKAIKAGKGGENLASDQMMTQVGQALPPNRIAEGYLGTKSLMDLLLPLAGMAGVQMQPDQIPDSLPPVAAAVSGQEGTARFALFVPAPVIKTAAKVGMAVQQQMGGEDAPEPEKGGKGRTGQPRF